MCLSDVDYYLHNSREGTVTCDLVYVLCCAVRHPRDLLPPNLLLPQHFSLPSTTHVLIGKATRQNHTWTTKQFLRGWVSELPTPSPWITHAKKATTCFDCCTVSRLLLEWAKLITVGAFCRRGGAQFQMKHTCPHSHSRPTPKYFSQNTFDF